MLSTGWQTGDVVGVAVVGQNGRPVEPTTENVAAGAYSISRDLALVTEGSPRGPAALFVEFLLSPAGQAVVEEQGYTSLASKAGTKKSAESSKGGAAS